MSQDIISKPHGNTRHGGSNTREYRSWQHMLERCFNPTCKAWKHYGGRGITVCDEWRHDFAAFLAHVGPRPGDGRGYSIDRFPNNDGNYEPGNVRWARMWQQNRNKRTNVLIGDDVLTDACEKRGVKVSRAVQRRLRGFVGDDLFRSGRLENRAPITGRPPKEIVKYNGETRFIPDVCAQLGMRVGLAYERRAAGWPDERLFIAPKKRGNNA